MNTLYLKQRIWVGHGVADLDKEMFIVGLRLLRPLLLHEGGELDEAEFGCADAPALPSWRGRLGRAGQRAHTHTFK